MLENFLREAKNSFCFTEGAKEIIRTCKPFLDKHGFKNFYYVSISKKGELVFLTNRVDYAMNYWEAGLPTRTGWDETLQGVQNYTILWNESNLDKEILDFTSASHCYDGFTFARRYPDMIQGVTFFRDHLEENPSHYYLHKKEEMRCWVREFEWKCRHLIQHAEERPMILPQEYLASEQKTFYPERTVAFCYRSIRSKVSFRELDCLSLHAKGFTWPHIAEMLGLSVRTVETHFASLKNRFGLTSRDELAYLAWANPLIQTYCARF